MKDHVAYVYTRKYKNNEKVGKTMPVKFGKKETGVYFDYDKNGMQGVEFLEVYEIWVNGRRVWSEKDNIKNKL